MSAPPELAIASAPHPPVLEMRGVVKRYGDVEALSGLDLVVRPGEVYGFLGRNGAGKTTALRILMGITHATRGQVALFGQDVHGGSPALRRRIGYVAQEQNFYGWMTPVRLGHFLRGFYPTWDDAEYKRLLGLLEVPFDRKLGTFSGGTTAKLALAAALAHHPDLLVLDEPTAGMDAVARREFLELVRAQADRAGRATIFSSHLIDEVELAADTVGIVDGGRMLWQGPLQRLRDEVRVFRSPLDGAAVWPAELAHPEQGISILFDRVEADERAIMVWVRDVDASAPTIAALERLRAAAAGWRDEEPSLEDIFIALVRRRINY
ncbi:MAG: ABC transporter ATP-binding protein [Deltaproteobacteria bacterium]|nr:ABC transporter ATP-binding protein [Deltaproteobacteria bacterium]